VVGAVVGRRLGWSPVLVPWAYFVPVGVMLAVVDWRVRLLPTRVIAPSYGVLVALLLVAALLHGDWHVLIGAAIGWAVYGVLYFLLWFVQPGGLGYGDVRLSGLIGLVLGVTGIEEVLGGLLAGSLLGGIGALGLRLGTGRKYVPYGPFMLLGSLVGLVSAPWLVHLGY
jgi:leader peptidase (prepilin peptidase)/N-methyltransferase